MKIASMSDPIGLIFRREKEEVDPLLQRNEEGSLRLNATELKARGFNFFRNTQTVAYNTGQFGKGMAKKAAAKLRENMDAQMQKQVDVVTTSYNPMKAFPTEHRDGHCPPALHFPHHVQVIGCFFPQKHFQT